MSQHRIEIEEMVELISTCAGIDTDPGAAATLTFEELGVDSLAVMGLVAELERRTGRKFDQDAESLPTPTALLALVNDEAPAVTGEV